jgi:hypothetical protein
MANHIGRHLFLSAKGPVLVEPLCRRSHERPFDRCQDPTAAFAIIVARVRSSLSVSRSSLPRAAREPMSSLRFHLLGKANEMMSAPRLQASAALLAFHRQYRPEQSGPLTKSGQKARPADHGGGGGHTGNGAPTEQSNKPSAIVGPTEQSRQAVRNQQRLPNRAARPSGTMPAPTEQAAGPSAIAAPTGTERPGRPQSCNAYRQSGPSRPQSSSA